MRKTFEGLNTMSIVSVWGSHGGYQAGPGKIAKVRRFVEAEAGGMVGVVLVLKSLSESLSDMSIWRGICCM